MFAVIEFKFDYFYQMSQFPSSHLFQYGFGEAPVSPYERGTNDSGTEPCFDFGGGVVVVLAELPVGFPEYLFGVGSSVVFGCGCVALVVDEFSKDGGLLGERYEFYGVVDVSVELRVVLVGFAGG